MGCENEIICRKAETHYDQQREMSKMVSPERCLLPSLSASVSDVSGLEYHAPTGFAAGATGRESKNDSGGQFRVAARSTPSHGGGLWAQRRYPQPEGIAKADNENNVWS